MERIEKFTKNEVIFRQGDPSQGQLIYVIEGSLLVCTNKGKELTPLAIVKEEEFIGEVSFFLDRPQRSANVITQSECSLLIIDHETLTQTIPDWLTRIFKSMAYKLQQLDCSLNEARIKKRSKKLPGISHQEMSLLLELISKR